MPLLNVAGIPFPLQSEGRPSGHEPHPMPSGVRLTAGPRADLFLDPQGAKDAPDAERFVALVAGNFQLSAHTTVDFKSTFDSGVLIGYVDESTWFKLCAELDPAGTARVVSVVTRQGASDDSNSWPMSGPGVYLRIARLGRAFAMHASDDGASWSMVRYFSLGIPDDQPIKLGILAQSPTGEGATVRFENVQFCTNLLTGVRDGS